MGYDWNAGKSVRAVQAEEDGLLTATEMAKYLKARFPKSYRGVTAGDINLVVVASEWHHTSKMYNKTNYFSLGAVCDYRRELQAQIINRKQAAKLFKILAEDNRVVIHINDGTDAVWHYVAKNQAIEYLDRLETEFIYRK